MVVPHGWQRQSTDSRGRLEGPSCAAVSRPQHGPDRRSPRIAVETCGRRFRRGRETCAEVLLRGLRNARLPVVLRVSRPSTSPTEVSSIAETCGRRSARSGDLRPSGFGEVGRPRRSRLCCGLPTPHGPDRRSPRIAGRPAVGGFGEVGRPPRAVSARSGDLAERRHAAMVLNGRGVTNRFETVPDASRASRQADAMYTGVASVKARPPDSVPLTHRLPSVLRPCHPCGSTGTGGRPTVLDSGACQTPAPCAALCRDRSWPGPGGGPPPPPRSGNRFPHGWQRRARIITRCLFPSGPVVKRRPGVGSGTVLYRGFSCRRLPTSRNRRGRTGLPSGRRLRRTSAGRSRAGHDKPVPAGLFAGSLRAAGAGGGRNRGVGRKQAVAALGITSGAAIGLRLGLRFGGRLLPRLHVGAFRIRVPQGRELPDAFGFPDVKSRCSERSWAMW